MSPLQSSMLTIFVDCVSPYSWFGFTNILRYRPNLQAHGVAVNIVPFFLGAARNGVGNLWQPTPKWREAFSTQDLETTGRLLGLKPVTPSVFPISSLYAIRVATYIKDHYSSSQFESTFEAFASGYWSKGIDISTTDGIVTALKPIFSKDELEKILKGAVSPENKKRVVEQTMGSAAFGAPWIIAETADGRKKSWFGNDRWDQVFEHLGVPYKPVEVLPVSKAESKL